MTDTDIKRQTPQGLLDSLAYFGATVGFGEYGSETVTDRFVFYKSKTGKICAKRVKITKNG